jgi:transketolase
VTSTEQTNDFDALTTAVVPGDWSEVDKRAVDTVRVLAADAVQKVGNGHPGTAMSLAPLAYTLFQRVMRHDPADPHWVGRDRFVLSCGHYGASAEFKVLYQEFGITADAAVAAAHESLAAAAAGAGPSTESSPDQLTHAGADQPHP